MLTQGGQPFLVSSIIFLLLQSNLLTVNEVEAGEVNDDTMVWPGAGNSGGVGAILIEVCPNVALK